jgi:hypothetical protein
MKCKGCAREIFGLILNLKNKYGKLSPHSFTERTINRENIHEKSRFGGAFPSSWVGFAVSHRADTPNRQPFAAHAHSHFAVRPDLRMETGGRGGVRDPASPVGFVWYAALFPHGYGYGL